MKHRLILNFFRFFFLLSLKEIHGKGATPAISEEIISTANEFVFPWFTGPLLTPSGRVVPVATFNFEPYLFATVNYGEFDKNWSSHSSPKFVSINPQLAFSVGTANRLEYQFVIEGFYNHAQKGGSSVRFGDVEMGFNFQVVQGSSDTWYPSIKLGIKEIFPAGQFQKLNPHKHDADVGGSGSFQTGVSMAASKLFHLSKVHYLNSRLYFSYFFPSSVHVKGFSTYGGGFKTNGKVAPGNVFTALLGLELSLTRNWVFALDVMNLYQNKTRFSGKGATTQNKVGFPSLNQISFAPAIEYNFSEFLGIIAGVWFTAFGRNASEFISGVVAVNLFGSFISKSPK